MLALAQKGTLVQASFARRAFPGETGTLANPPLKSGIIQAPGQHLGPKKVSEGTFRPTFKSGETSAFQIRQGIEPD